MTFQVFTPEAMLRSNVADISRGARNSVVSFQLWKAVANGPLRRQELLLLTLAMKNKWVHETNMKRPKFGEYHHLAQELSGDEKYINNILDCILRSSLKFYQLLKISRNKL